jgi:L-asparagine transporter-like permease
MSTLTVALIVYLITTVSSIDGFLIFLAVVGVISFVLNAIFTIMAYSDLDREDEENFNREMAPIRTWRKWSVAIFILGALNIFVPDEEQAITIAAVAIGYEGVTTIVENERVQELGGKTVDYLEDWLDNKIEELNTERAESPTTEEVTEP